MAKVYQNVWAQFCKLCFLTCHRPAWRSDWGSAPLVGNRRIFSFFVLLPYFLSNKINSQIPDDTQYLDAAAVSSCDVCTRRKVAGILCILGICSASPPIDGQSTARRHILHFNRELSLSVNGIQPGTFVYSKKNPSPKKWHKGDCFPSIKYNENLLYVRGRGRRLA